MQFILSSKEIKDWDQFTITHNNIRSIDLMEYAASQCTKWITEKWDSTIPFAIFCGNGNNGGDGLVIAKQLIAKNYHVKVYIDCIENKSADNLSSLKSLKEIAADSIYSINEPFSIPNQTILIDAIFGIGLQRKVIGKEKGWIDRINTFNNIKISIDIPSGLCADINLRDDTIIKANYTLSFQCYKKTFLFIETGIYCGKIIILDINLDENYLTELKLNKIMITKDLLQPMYRERNSFSNKGNYGHSLLVVGSRGKMGAAILAARACLRSGTGLLSVYVPASENSIIQTAVPEAMSISYSNQNTISNIENFNSIGIGSGLGHDEIAKNLFTQLLSLTKAPIIIDADAINILSNNKKLLEYIPQGSIMTPHVKEFDRLFGPSYDAIERFEKQKQQSKELGIIILLKGKYTCITTPGGASYFNKTGNAGMASGGTGDVLTGIITGLFAQYKDLLKAALIGVYLHGLAADMAIEKEQSEESLIATDIIDYLGLSYQQLKSDC